MSASKKELHSKAETLQKKLAASEATTEILRGKLAVIQAQLDDAPRPVTGLDLLWKAALPISRLRSSNVQCRTEWNRIPLAERPTVREAVEALKLWNRCIEWKKDGNQFAKGLHLYIKNRLWEDPPEDSRPSARYQNFPKPLPLHTPEESASAQDIAEIFGALKPKRMNS